MMTIVKIYQYVTKMRAEKIMIIIEMMTQAIVMVMAFLIVKMSVQMLHDHDDALHFQIVIDHEILYDDNSDLKFSILPVLHVLVLQWIAVQIFGEAIR